MLAAVIAPSSAFAQVCPVESTLSVDLNGVALNSATPFTTTGAVGNNAGVTAGGIYSFCGADETQFPLTGNAVAYDSANFIGTNGGHYTISGDNAFFNADINAGQYVHYLVTITQPPTVSTDTVTLTYFADAANSSGATDKSITITFTNLSPRPAVTSVSPTSGPAAGGNSVTITGTDFKATAANNTVKFGATTVPTIDITSASTTQLVVNAPAGVGTVDVTVATLGGTSATSAADQYTYIQPPTVSAISPISGPTAGGTAVTITGTHFTGTTGVTIGGVAATGVTVVDDTTITATAPAHGPGAVSVLVSTSAGTNAANSLYTYIAPPTLTAISPTAGPTAGGTTITLTGTNFVIGDTSVTIGGTVIPAASVTVTSATSLTFTNPAHVAGNVAVSVTTIGGTSGNVPGGFSYLDAPTVTSLSPLAGPSAGGTTVTITGTNFVTAATSVTIGGNAVAAANVTVASPTSLTFSTPAHVAGNVAVVVETAGGTSGPVPGGFTYVDAPTVTAISPTSGPTGGGTTVIITGTNFTSVTAVDFGATAASGFIIDSATQITAISPSGGAGVIDVTVTSPGGTSATSAADQFTYFAPLTLASAAPSSGTTAGGTVVTLTGTNFVAGTTVTIGGVAATGITVVNATSITATTPAYVSGALAKDVVINNPGGSATIVGGFTYAAQGPTLASIAPNSGPIAGGTAVLLSGTDFVPGTSVTIGGVAATSITVVSATSITATIPAYVSGPLAKNVVVDNSVGTATLSNGFTYLAGAPTLASIAPNTGTTAGGTAVTLTGTNFVPGTTVTIDGVAATGITVVNATSITATTPAYASGALAKDVVVNNGVGNATLAGGFTYTASSPTLASIAPNSGATASGTAVTLTGTDFVPGTTVTIGGVAATGITVVSATSITATTPAYASGALAQDVVVNNGVGNATLAGGFTYTASSPTLASIAPNSGSTAGSTAVTLTGTDFVPGTTVTIGGVAATAITVVNSTSITATTPAYVSGALAKNVVVNNGVGNATLAGGFTYTAGSPTLASIAPNAGTTAGGTAVTLTGSNFVPGTTVTIGGVAATGVTVVSATSITATSPAYASGPVAKDVVVNNGTGSATLAGGFTYTASSPTLASIAPNSGTTAGGTAVTLTGTDFVPGTTVTIGGVAATGITVINSTSITATTPAYVSGALAKNVVVNNGAGNATLAGGFTYTASSPTLASVSPNSGASTAGTQITLTGTDFVPGTTVTIGGTAATGIVVVSATSITATTPIYVSGALAKDVVVNNGIGSATLTNGFTFVVGAPTLASIAPSTGPTAGGTAVTLTGTSFAPGTTVTIGGVAATGITVVNSTTITAATPAYVSGPVAKNVVVNNGTGSATLTGGFTYSAQVPTIASIAPNSGSTAGGTAVTLTGTEFVPGTTVTIGGVAATNVVVQNKTTLVANAPAYVSGALAKNVVVNNGAGNATLASGFTYVAQVPTIASIAPSSGSTAGGTAVTVTGTSFVPGTTVTIGGVAATAITVVNATSLTATTPAYVSGVLAKDVVVSNGAGNATLASGFTYSAGAPTLASLAPNTGPTAGGTVVTLTGTVFVPGTTVTIGGVAATAIVVNSATSLTATVPAYVSGALAKDVSVNNGSGSVTLAGGFTYTAGTPTISAIAPNSGTTEGGTAVTLTGTDFVPGATVTIGGTAATAVTVVSATSITATTPAHAAGAVNVVVTTSGGTATGTGLYTYVAPVSTTTLASSLNPAASGQSVTFTATVAATAAGTPTGDVTFKDGVATLGVVTLSGGTATFTTTTLSVGSHPITASYGGSAIHAASVSSTLNQAINKAGSTTVLTVSPSSPVVGQTVTLVAAIATAPATVGAGVTGATTAGADVTDPGAAAPSGTVIFRDGATVLGTQAVAGGSATFSTSSLAAGGHSLTATYDGDTEFETSVSLASALTVKLSCTDDFANAPPITGASGAAIGSTIGATGENGEPKHVGELGATNSVWCAWTAPATGEVTFDTTGSLYDTTLAVYTGAPVWSLTPVAANDNIAATTTQSRVTFAAVQGTTYMIAVDGAGAAVGDYILTWAQAPTSPSLFASVLPTSRSVVTGSVASAFATIINAGPSVASQCAIALPPGFPGVLSFQTTTPSNDPIGPENAPTDIQPGAAQTFVFGITPTSDLNAAEVALVFTCAGTQPAPSIPGLSTLTLSASSLPTPDILAIVSTLSNDGIVNVPLAGTGLFASAAVNIGAAGDITATVDDGGKGLPLTVTLCRSDAATGICLPGSTPSASQRFAFANGEIATFTVYVSATGPIAFSPAVNRLQLRLKTDDNVTRGSTTVAVRTQ